MRTQRHSLRSPRIKMILHVDTARAALALPDAPVLLKGARTVNRRLISAGRNSNVVCAAISCDCAFALRVRRRVVGAIGFHNVVFDQGVARPAVDSEVAVALRGEGAAVVDCSIINNQ